MLEKNKINCSGCGACLKVCPKKAITMELDEYGNKYPIINDNLCVKCGLCENICLYKKYNKQRDDLNCYAAYSKDDSIISNSSSGGLFGTIATNFIKNGGYVCGCSLQYVNDLLEIKHIIIKKNNELYKIQGSKYVQSNIIDVLPKIKELLAQGNKVLFSGTPCQIVGLKSYLRKEYENLYTIDIVCHGSPDTKFFNDYIKYIEDKKKIKITNIKFRDKTNGWALYGCGYVYGYYLKNKNKNIKMIFDNNESSYYYLFQNGYMFRPNCYNCPYASNKRPGDITIGDYWGIEKEHPEIKFNKGISCLCINNQKGNTLLEIYGQNLELYSSTFEKIQRNNSQLVSPTIEPELNKKIKNDYLKFGYRQIEMDFVYIYGRKNLIMRKCKTRIKKLLMRKRKVKIN